MLTGWLLGVGGRVGITTAGVKDAVGDIIVQKDVVSETQSLDFTGGYASCVHVETAVRRSSNVFGWLGPAGRPTKGISTDDTLVSGTGDGEATASLKPKRLHDAGFASIDCG